MNCASDCARNVLFALNIIDGTVASVYDTPLALPLSLAGSSFPDARCVVAPGAQTGGIRAHHGLQLAHRSRVLVRPQTCRPPRYGDASDCSGVSGTSGCQPL